MRHQEHPARRKRKFFEACSRGAGRTPSTMTMAILQAFLHRFMIVTACAQHDGAMSKSCWAMVDGRMV